MRFSLVVSTIGRVNDLRALLQSLAAQTYRDFEVIVVDQSRSSEINAVVQEFDAVLRLRHVPMSERGVSRGRNRGLALATGDIVTFPDDDCEYFPNVLADVAAVFDTRAEVDALSCRAVAPVGPQTINRFDMNGGSVDRSNLLRRFVEFTFFARREQFSGLSFDEAIGAGAGTPWGADEGPDLVLRMLARGCRMWYFPEIHILHPSPLAVLDEDLLGRSYAYSCARGRLFRTHRYPWYVVAHSLGRSLAGCCLNLARLRAGWARYYWLAFRGKLHGYLAVA